MESDKTTIKLTGDLSISDAVDLKEKFLLLLQEYNSIHINMSALEDMDASILQILCATCIQAKKEKKQVVFEGSVKNLVRRKMFISGLTDSPDLSDEAVLQQFMHKIGVAT